jgi:hypothetical protein
MVLERGEPGDCLPPDLEGRDAVGDPLPGPGKDLEDHLAQLAQRGALRFLQGIEVLVDLLSRHRPIVLIDEPGGQGPHPGQHSVAADRVLAGRRLRLPGELTRQIDQVTGPLRWVR